MWTLFGDEHVRRYQETEGAVGYDWEDGTTILLLTTTGRKSGQQRTKALIYRDWEGSQLVVASKGGAPKPPSWLRNIEADPNVQVQIKADRFPARARIASAAERPRLWRLMTEVWPAYDEYQQKTDREIPVVVLERI
jgi:deazaflavin-dependent oxidoreductase (nitroreductase family)